jgi:hypothetical protein
VTVGEADTTEPVVADRPVDGDQEYALPPVAVRLSELPVHITTPEPTLIVGTGLTVAVVVYTVVGAQPIPVLLNVSE